MKHRCTARRQVPASRYYIFRGLYTISIIGLSRLQSLLIFLLLFEYSVAGYSQSQQSLKADVVIVGGGTGGTAAAIQSARSGATTILVCEKPWPGGMLTAAGVSCTDGNHNLPAGIWEEFRQAMYQHYGKKNLASGWVSNFNFEPHVGDSIFKAMTKRESNLKVLYGYKFDKKQSINYASNDQLSIKELVVSNGKTAFRLQAGIYVDATELGDVAAASSHQYDVGLEPDSLSGETANTTSAYGVIQDLTYAATLKDYGPGADKTIAKPANYNPMEFDCCCNAFCSDTKKLYSNVDAQKMLNYGKLTTTGAAKYMLNWPANGNDFYTNTIHLSRAEEAKALDSAKEKTLRFIYFIQTQLGFKNLGLADDEFTTPDKLPYIPYHREGRRVRGLVRLTTKDIINPGENSNLYRTGISVGDYPIDHHHKQYPGDMPELKFPAVPSYNIPVGALIPKDAGNLIVCDKSISVSNIMNGTTRLQPVVLLTGQAAGALAAICAKENKRPAQINIRYLQSQLLKAKAYIMPYADVQPGDIAWAAIQRTGATGILKGIGKTEGWANKTYFLPDTTVAYSDLENGLYQYYRISKKRGRDMAPLTIGEAFELIEKAMEKPGKRIATTDTGFQKIWVNMKLKNYNAKRLITKRELAVTIDQVLFPFYAFDLDFNGMPGKRKTGLQVMIQNARWMIKPGD